MNSQYPWAKALEISEQSLQEWQKDLKPDESLLFKLILEKKVDEEKYLLWARKQYELASVGRSYFSSRLDAETWHTTRVEYRWTCDFLPLTIWDDTLFIGCLEPRQDLPSFSRPIKLLLAPATGLNRLWKFNLSDMGVAVAETKPAPIADKSIEIASPAEKPKEKPKEKPESKNQPLSDLSFAGLSLDKLPAQPSPAAKAAANPAPVFTLDNFAEKTTMQPLAKEPAPAAVQKPPGPPPSILKKAVAPPPPPMSQVSTSIDIKIDIPKNETISFGKVVNLNLAPTNIDQIKNIDELAAYALKEMAVTFEKSMLLVYEDFKLRAKRWTANWSPDPKFQGTPLVIDLPNIFKIVHDSRMPFHGPISVNPTNKQFFDHWNSGHIPNHITIYPIVSGASLFGFVLGITNKEIHLTNSLDLLAQLVNQLNVSLKKMAA